MNEASSNKFKIRKKQQLLKKDRSLKSSIDEKIKYVCELINQKEDYYTTSSCSGRIVLFRDCVEKKDDVIIKSWHDKIRSEDILNELKERKEEIIYLKFEPSILHICCNSIKSAQKILSIAITKAGWKRSGILSFSKRIIVELNLTYRIELPIKYYNWEIKDKELIKILVKECNKKLDLCWNRIKKLENEIKKI